MTALKPNEEGIFFNVAHDVYHADAEYEIPSLSGSLAKYMILDTPRHAWYNCARLNKSFKPKHKSIWDRGSAAHSLLLDSREEIAVLDFKDRRTNAYKDAENVAREAGKIPMLSKDYDELIEMHGQALSQLDALECGNPFAVGSPEVVIRWKEEFSIHGKVYTIWCRAKMDWLNPEIENLYDVKTSEGSMNPKTWMKWRMWDQGAPYQSAMYRRGIRRLSYLGKLKMHDPDFLFLLVESKPPFCMSLVNTPSDLMPPHSTKTADQILLEAMVKWDQCREENNWPGYETSVVVAEGHKPKYIGVPMQESQTNHTETGWTNNVPDVDFEVVSRIQE